MGDLTEREIFDCLETNFRLAAEDAENLARSPRRGPIYRSFRERLILIEGACRQASAWRSDTRWLKIGLYAAEVHKNAGDWLRGIKRKDGGPRIRLAEGHIHPLFQRAAIRLHAAHQVTIEYRDKKTGRVGMILPAVQAGPHRDTRPVGWTRTNSGLVIPSGAAVQ